MESKQLRRLRSLLNKHFAESELKNLCTDLEIDYEELPRETKKDLTRELLRYLKRRRKLDELITRIQEIRPELADDLPQTLPETTFPGEIVVSSPLLSGLSLLLLISLVTVLLVPAWRITTPALALFLLFALGVAFIIASWLELISYNTLGKLEKIFSIVIGVTLLVLALPFWDTVQSSNKLHIESEGDTADTYILAGDALDSYHVGDRLVVYETIADKEIPIGLLTITAIYPDSLYAQAQLEHTDHKIRSGLPVDANTTELKTSELIPSPNSSLGYLLEEGKARFRPGAPISHDLLLQVLVPQEVDNLIIDYIRQETPILQVSQTGENNIVAEVDMVKGNVWPAPGSILAEASVTPSSLPLSSTSTSAATFAASVTKTPSATYVPPSTPTPSPTTLAPSITSTPSPSPTTTPSLLENTVPRPAAPLEPDRVDQISELARWGKGTINQIATAPDGQTLAIASAIGVHRFDMETEIPLSTLYTNSWTRGIAFSPDGQLLVTGDDNGDIRLWQMSDGRLLNVLDAHDDSIRSLAFSPDGQFLASAGDDHYVRIWRITRTLDAAEGRPVREMKDPHQDQVWSVSFSADGKTMASAACATKVDGWQCVDGAIYLWDVEGWHNYAQLEGHTDRVNNLAFSPQDPNVLVSGANDDTIRIWQLNDSGGESRYELSAHRGHVLDVTFSPDGAYLASAADDGTVRIWNVDTGGVEAALPAHRYTARSVTFLNNASLLSGGWDGQIVQWDWESGDYTLFTDEFYSWVTALDFSPDSVLLAHASADRQIYLWDIAAGAMQRSLAEHTNDVNAISFSPQEDILMSGSDDNALSLWSIPDGSLLRRWTNHDSDVNALTISSDGRSILSGSCQTLEDGWRCIEGAIGYWQISEEHTIDLISIFSAHDGAVHCIDISPDGTYFASGGTDGAIILWDADSRTPLQELTAHTESVNALAFSPNGLLLASASDDNTVRLWEVNTGENISTLEEHDGDVLSLDFSVDGALLTTGSADNTVWIWTVDSNSALPLRLLEGHTGDVRALVFSPDGMLLASGADDGTIRFWGISETVP